MASGTKAKAKAKAPGPGRPARAKNKGAEWTEAKQALFFGELAMVCNVTAALKAAGMLRARRSVYVRRKRDPEFRASWEEAIGESYAMLELEMLERARGGDERPEPASPAEARRRDVPDRIALQLLRQHRQPVKARSPAYQRPMRGEKLREELERRLAEISRRLGGAG